MKGTGVAVGLSKFDIEIRPVLAIATAVPRMTGFALGTGDRLGLPVDLESSWAKVRVMLALPTAATFQRPDEVKVIVVLGLTQSINRNVSAINPVFLR